MIAEPTICLMIDAPRVFRLPGPALNSGAAGLRLADEVLAALGECEVVRVDVAEVERMTASFANSLVMPLLERVGVEAIGTRVVLVGASDGVSGEWRKAVERYTRGVRLSIQRPESE